MAKCVFCERVSGHTEACPITERRAMALPTAWESGTGLELDLARSLITAWQADSCVYDRGSSRDVERLEALWAGMEAELERGSAEGAMALLMGDYSKVEGSSPIPGHGVSGEGSPLGDTP